MDFFFSASRNEYAQMAVRNRALPLGKVSAARTLEAFPKAASIGKDFRRSLRFIVCLS